MALTSPSVIFVLPDKMGGVLNMVSGILESRLPDAFSYGAVLTHNPLQGDGRFGGSLHADFQTTVEFRTPVDNIHAVLRRLRSAIPPGEGVLVANDLIELAFASAFDCGRTVVQILHGDHEYYYDLAARHEDVVDAFVVLGRAMERTLKARLPHRADDVYCLPFGIPEPPRRRAPSASGPLRLLYAGRLEDDQKGVLDLPLIDRHLADGGIDVRWTIVGSGPDERRLRDAWTAPRVTFTGARSRADVMAIAADHDVFVLPTRYEGLPVALLEAMSVGLAPVVSRVESGVLEVLAEGETRLMPAVGDTRAFADAIARLDADRPLLESIGDAARRYVTREYDIRTRTAAYQALFARYREVHRPRPERTRLPYGSRLDQPWLPNFAVRTVRGILRRAQGKPA